MNSWSKRSEFENIALFVAAIGLVFTMVGLSTAQLDMIAFGFLAACVGILAFLYFNARRTKAQRKDKAE